MNGLERVPSGMREDDTR